MIRNPLLRLVQAGVLTAVIDGLFSSVLSAVFYHSTVARLFQGVSSTLLGPSAVDGGSRPALIGVLMHIGVAFGWSAVFLFLASRFEGIRRVLTSPWGGVKVAAVYGPCVWLVMSLLVIPIFRGAPHITYRWWIQLIGHFPFVGLPIVASIRRGVPTPDHTV